MKFIATTTATIKRIATTAIMIPVMILFCLSFLSGSVGFFGCPPLFFDDFVDFSTNSSSSSVRVVRSSCACFALVKIVRVLSCIDKSFVVMTRVRSSPASVRLSNALSESFAGVAAFLDGCCAICSAASSFSYSSTIFIKSISSFVSSIRLFVTQNTSAFGFIVP